MPEVSARNTHQSYILKGAAWQAAHLMHSIVARLDTLSEGRVQTLTAVDDVKKALNFYELQLHAQFNMEAGDTLARLGLDKPVTQVCRGDYTGRLTAYECYPSLSAVTPLDPSGDMAYMLHVPIAYNADRTVPRDSILLKHSDFLGGGLGNQMIIGQGALVFPPLIDLTPKQIHLPKNYSPQHHNWLQLDHDPAPLAKRRAKASLKLAAV